MLAAVAGLKKRSAWARWTPDPDTAAAAGSAIAMIPLYYLSVHLSGWPGTLVVFIQMVLLGVVFPVWWVAWHRKKTLADLGITGKHAVAGLVIGIVLACLFAKPLFDIVAGPAIVPHLLTNACMFWEPFFVFGWLFLAFDRAFGSVPGILGASLAFTAYHLGTYPLAGLAMLFVVGIVFGCIFCEVKNILILWPFAWTFSSGIGTAMGGMVFSWADLPVSAAILAVSLACIGYTALAAPKIKKD